MAAQAEIWGHDRGFSRLLLGLQAFRTGLFAVSQCPGPGRGTMTKTPQMERVEVLRIKLERLRQDHRDLDEAIHALHEQGRADVLTLQRLKRQKLALKDQIARFEDEITPDIIA